MENAILSCMKSRRSTKSYDPDSMPSEELLEQIAEAGTWAPTGKGRQSPFIVVVTDKPTRDRLSRLNAEILGTSSDPFYGAPAVIAVLADRNIPTYLYDGSLVMGNMLNAASSLGLGSCWIHRAKEVFHTDEGMQMLEEWGIEPEAEGIGFCVVGYPAENCKNSRPATPRKPGYIRYI